MTSLHTEFPRLHTCDCPDFTFKREGIDPEGCKHIKALVACGLIEPKLGEVPAAETILGTPSHREKVTTDQAAVTATIEEQAQSVVPANGQPTTFLEIVEHEALGYRAWGTTAGSFLADQLGASPSSYVGPAPELRKTTTTGWKSTTGNSAIGTTSRATRTVSRLAVARRAPAGTVSIDGQGNPRRPRNIALAKETPRRTPPRVGSVPGAMLTSSLSMECPGLPESRIPGTCSRSREHGTQITCTASLAIHFVEPWWRSARSLSQSLQRPPG